MDNVQVASEVGLSLDSPTPVNLELPADHECIERRSQLKTWQDEKKASKHFAVEVGSALVCGDVCNSGKSVASDRNEHNRRWQQQEKITHPYAGELIFLLLSLLCLSQNAHSLLSWLLLLGYIIISF